ncbi:MAG: Zn-ribbon domain-containing OB-fold protein [Candidatus Thorarchaeota archaeon]
MSEETTIKNYFRLINEKKLCAAHCGSCNELLLPPRLYCPKCNTKTTDWKTLSGEGRLRSFTVIHIAGTSYADDVPYIVAIIELKEGPSVCARLVGVDPMKPEDIHVGDTVVADFEEVLKSTSKEKEMRLVFRPAYPI